MNENQTNPNDQLLISYLTLRKLVGYLGVGLPVILVVGLAFAKQSPVIQSSISYFYHTDVRDIFVGVLCAVSLFLFTYTGYPKSLDNILANVAAAGALGVAFFPTDKAEITTIGILHYIFATVFFLTLAYFSYFQFTQTKGSEKPTDEKRKRNKIYRTCAITMVACLIIIAIYSAGLYKVIYIKSLVFWMEALALWAFGISWLTKGETLFPDKSE